MERVGDERSWSGHAIGHENQAAIEDAGYGGLNGHLESGSFPKGMEKTGDSFSIVYEKNKDKILKEMLAIWLPALLRPGHAA